jgi:hypothetical protein
MGDIRTVHPRCIATIPRPGNTRGGGHFWSRQSSAEIVVEMQPMPSTSTSRRRLYWSMGTPRRSSPVQTSFAGSGVRSPESPPQKKRLRTPERRTPCFYRRGLRAPVSPLVPAGDPVFRTSRLHVRIDEAGGDDRIAGFRRRPAVERPRPARFPQDSRRRIQNDENRPAGFQERGRHPSESESGFR